MFFRARIELDQRPWIFALHNPCFMLGPLPEGVRTSKMAFPRGFEPLLPPVKGRLPVTPPPPLPLSSDPPRPALWRAHDAVQSARFRADADAVSHALEFRRQPLERCSAFELGLTVAAAHAQVGTVFLSLTADAAVRGV